MSLREQLIIYSLVFASCTCFPSQVCAIASGDETRTVTNLATVPLGVLFNDNSYTAVASFRGITYFVWINSDDRPKVGMLKNGVFTSAYLSPITTYTIRNDGHHYFSLGVDNDGYIHVTGDMHNYPAADMTLYPDEYKSKIIMYWVSKQPENIDFEFVGGDAARAMPGYGFSYHSFQYDQDRNLYFLARIKVHKGGHKPGEMGLGLFRYSAATRSWTALGGYAPSNPAAIFRSIVWEDNGDADAGGWYQGFRASCRFDLDNRLHYAASIWNDSTKSDPTHILYGRSDDCGLTYKRGDGTAVNAPIRVDAGPNQGDIVAGPGAYDLFASVAFNLQGSPLAGYSENRDRSYFSYKYRLPGQGWSAQVQDPFNTYIRCKYHLDSWGVITLMTPFGSYRRLNDFSSAGYNSSVNVNNSFVCVDELGLRENGEFIGISKGTGTVSLVKHVITPNLSALPAAWTAAAIGTVNSPLSGQFNGVYGLGGSSAGAAGTADSLQWAWQQATGDIDIMARVISLGWSSDAAQAGVMIRQDACAGSKMAAAAITYRQGAKLITRGTASSAAEVTVKTGYTASEWLRLVKQGNTVTAYRSGNGQSWETIGSKTVVFSGIVQAGFFYSSASTSGSQAHFDNITISSQVPSPTMTATRTRTPAATNTYTATRAAAKTSTPVPTGTFTAVPSKTFTPSLTAINTKTRTPVPTLTDTAVNTKTFTPVPVKTFTCTTTGTFTPLPTLTATAESTKTSTPAPTATFTVLNTSTATATLTGTIIPSATFTATLTLTTVPSVTATKTSTATVTSTASVTAEPSLTKTQAETVTAPATQTATATRTSTLTHIPLSPTPAFTSTPNLSGKLSFVPGGELQAYPNPITGSSSFTLVFDITGMADSAEIKVYTVSGRLVRKIQAQGPYYEGRNSIKIEGRELSALAAGTYICAMKLEGKSGPAGGKTIIIRLR